MSRFLVASLLTTTIFLSACAPRLGGNDYSVSNAGDLGEILPGTIVGRKVVKIAGRDAGKENTPGVGALIGGGTGALLGSQIGGGRGRYATGAVGGLLGGIAGHYAEKALTEQEGFEYQIRLDSGKSVSIVQGAEPNLGVGQRVNVLVSTSGKRSRVLPA
ncbi:MAG: glycine zipper 2TM domain-containing protein [Chlamydiales bacterium]|nr:glycine zipper 2TM domain-containing protein [Chlamydiales bacterium]